MSDDRRAEARFACELEARVFEPGAPARALGTPVSTVDLSMSGICLQGPAAIERGETFDIELRLSRGHAISEPLRLSARAVWVTRVAEAHQVGAAFLDDLPALAWTRLDVMLKFLRGELELPAARS